MPAPALAAEGGTNYDSYYVQKRIRLKRAWRKGEKEKEKREIGRGR